MNDIRLVRIDKNRLRFVADTPFPVQIFANENLSIEPVAVGELLE